MASKRRSNSAAVRWSPFSSGGITLCGVGFRLSVAVAMTISPVLRATGTQFFDKSRMRGAGKPRV